MSDCPLCQQKQVRIAELEATLAQVTKHAADREQWKAQYDALATAYEAREAENTVLAAKLATVQDNALRLLGGGEP
jgi:predicted methyltransferase